MSNLLDNILSISSTDSETEDKDVWENISLQNITCNEYEGPSLRSDDGFISTFKGVRLAPSPDLDLILATLQRERETAKALVASQHGKRHCPSCDRDIGGGNVGWSGHVDSHKHMRNCIRHHDTWLRDDDELLIS